MPRVVRSVADGASSKREGLEEGTVNIAVIGTGFIGGVLGRALAASGHQVAFGSRHPENRDVAGDTTCDVTTIGRALASADVVILALPGAAVTDLMHEHGDGLDGKLVIDATNQMGQP